MTLGLACGVSGLAFSMLGLTLSRRAEARRRCLVYLALGLIFSALASRVSAIQAGEILRIDKAHTVLGELAAHRGDELIESQEIAVDRDRLDDYARVRYVSSGVHVMVVDEAGTRRPFEPSEEDRRAHEGWRFIRDSRESAIRFFAQIAALFPLLSGILVWLALWRSPIGSPGGAAGLRA